MTILLTPTSGFYHTIVSIGPKTKASVVASMFAAGYNVGNQVFQKARTYDGKFTATSYHIRSNYVYCQTINIPSFLTFLLSIVIDKTRQIWWNRYLNLSFLCRYVMLSICIIIHYLLFSILYSIISYQWLIPSLMYQPKWFKERMHFFLD